MNINKKIVYIIAFVLMGVWVGNIIYYEKHVINEHLFIKHYYDVSESMDSLRLYYVESINSKDNVTSVMFPEIGQEYENFIETDIGSSNSPYYKLKTITVNLYSGGINTLPDKYKNKLITTAEVRFSSGKMMNVNVGRLYFHSYANKNSDLKLERQSSSSDNNGGTTLYTDKDIYVTSISNRFYNEIKDILRVSIDGKPLSDVKFPIKLKAGQTIDMTYQFKFSNKKDTRLNNAYNLVFDISTEDLQGNRGISNCYIDFYPNSVDNINVDILKR